MNNVFRDALAEVGIKNGIQLAERLECPAVIIFLAGPHLKVPHAELRIWEEGKERHFTFSPRHPGTMSVAAMRRKTVEEAQEKAKETLGPTEWSRAPFSNCWMPSRYLQEARQRYYDPVQTG